MNAVFTFLIVVLVASIQALSHLRGSSRCSMQQLQEMTMEFEAHVTSEYLDLKSDVEVIHMCTQDDVSRALACIKANKKSADVVVKLIHTIQEQVVQLLRDYLKCIIGYQREANNNQEGFVLIKSLADGSALSHNPEGSDCTIHQLQELWESYNDKIDEAWDSNLPYTMTIMECINGDKDVLQCIKINKDAAEKFVNLAQTITDLINQLLTDSLKCISG